MLEGQVKMMLPLLHRRKKRRPQVQKRLRFLQILFQKSPQSLTTDNSLPPQSIDSVGLRFKLSYIGRIEREEVNITLETLCKISDALRINPIQLFEDEKNERPRKSKSEILDKIDTLLIPLTVDELQVIHRALKEILSFKNLNKGKSF